MRTDSNLGPCLEKQRTSQLNETSPPILVCVFKKQTTIINSKHLQSEDYDLPSGMELLKDCKDIFKDLRSDTAFNEMLCDARELAEEIDISANFELTQLRYRFRVRE
ncbi:uncharacterized protein TNCV_3942571 [Trichonephila clavipes]|nr:uncharacterized protein TNCV_3942571 [Trichonephila clavipes]